MVIIDWSVLKHCLKHSLYKPWFFVVVKHHLKLDWVLALLITDPPSADNAILNKIHIFHDIRHLTICKRRLKLAQIIHLSSAVRAT